MARTTRERIRSLLRQSGPLAVDEIVAQLAALEPIASKNPRQTVRGALANDPSCASAGENRYVYLPTFVRGASVRQVMDLAAPEKGLLAADVELFALFWPPSSWEESTRAATLSLQGGPRVAVERRGVPTELRFPMALPAPFWRWWEAQREAGADALLVRCDDGEAGHYTVSGVRTEELDAGAVAARNAQLREAAVAVLQRTQGLRPELLALRLLARGVHHGAPPPDSLSRALFEPTAAFFPERGGVTYRPEITPSLRRLFASRIEAEQEVSDRLLDTLMDLRPLPEPEEPRRVQHPRPEVGGTQASSSWGLDLRLEPEDLEDLEESEALEEPEESEPSPGRSAPRPEQAAQLGYRIKVSLKWKPSVWRAIEILDNQTLEELHYAIQDAFDWGDDHLYAFFLSGRAWDALTAVARPGSDSESPTADEVTLHELELKPGQRFLYIFDFGDDLRHEIEILGSFPVPASGEFPRIVESHGKAPPQYPKWDDEEDGEDTAEE